jgi:hypothetical protein
MSNLFANNLAMQRQRTATDEQQRASKAEREEQEKQSWHGKMQTYDVRIAKFITTVPESVQRDGLPMALFIANLKGKYKGQANAPDVGKALRSMGWIRTRQWRNESDGFSALWLPPVKPDKPATASLTPPATPDQTPTEPLKGSAQ